ncbi:MAG: hypothetical protein V4598_15425 [Bdellovibrionota bacterium]
MIKLKIVLVLSLVVTLNAWSVTYCTTRELSWSDPHQISDQVSRFIYSQIHATLFNTPEMVRNLKQSKPDTWFVTLNTGKKVDAADVVFSINRQLIRNADFESDEEAFLPAKLSGLEKFLLSAVALSPTEIELKFTQPVTEAQLKSILDSSVGIILPKTFDINVGPAKGAGKSPMRKSDLNQIVMGNDEATGFTIKVLSPVNLTLESAKKQNCKRLYYPTERLVEGVKEKKVNGTLIRTSSTLLYLHLFPGVKLAPEQISRLRFSFHPDRMKGLRDAEKTNRIFAISSHGQNRVDPVKKNYELPSNIVTCDHMSLSADNRSLVETHLEKNLKDALGIEPKFERIGCSRIVASLPNYDRLGVLSSLEFRSADELNRALDCDVTSVKVFGICTIGTPETREAEILKTGRILPLARIANEFIEFF